MTFSRSKAVRISFTSTGYASSRSRMLVAVCRRAGFVRYVGELQGAVAVVVRKAQGRGEIVFRTVRRERFVAGRKQAQVFRAAEGRSQITLAKPSLIVDTVQEVGLIGVDADQGLFGSADVGCEQCQQEGQ